MEFFAPASPGTEELLRDELCELGFAEVRLNRGGIPFTGGWEDGWRACLESRIAQRIQVLMLSARADTADKLYAAVRAIDWLPYLSPRQTLAVSCFCRSPYFSHSGFVALKVKDALVDQVRDACGQRPSVAKDDPDVRVFVFVSGDRLKVYLDLSGEALHRRGYRTATGEAPVRETLAAALLRFSGWDRCSPLADPMCGSGTIVIEAALWAGNVAPGLFRQAFGFERWASFDDSGRDAMRELRGAARAAAHRQTPAIIGGDTDETVLALARANAQAAGTRIQFRHGRIQDFQVSNKVTTIISNPPYDQRLDVSPEGFGEIAAAFSRMHGKCVCLLSGHPDLDRRISVAARDRLAVKNGSLDCECLVYDVP
jgi:putative N6-adenine-specific DNA methylase